MATKKATPTTTTTSELKSKDAMEAKGSAGSTNAFAMLDTYIELVVSYSESLDSSLINDATVQAKRAALIAAGASATALDAYSQARLSQFAITSPTSVDTALATVRTTIGNTIVA